MYNFIFKTDDFKTDTFLGKVCELQDKLPVLLFDNFKVLVTHRQGQFNIHF